jgi:7 transmembrane receptor (rhodopsin family).
MENQTSSRSQSPSPLQCQLSTTFILLYITAALITLIVVLGNGFILWTLKGRQKSTYDILLCYLSTFDLLAAVTMMARIYTEVTKCSSKWLFGRFGCKLLLPFYDVSINISVCILIIISIDRCRTLTQPLGAHKSRKFIHVVVGVSIVLSSVVYFERFMTSTVRDGVCAYFLDGSLLNLSPFLVWSTRDTTFLLIFSLTSFIIKRSLKQVPNLSKEFVRRKKAQSKKVYNNLLMMQIIFSLLVLPYDILSCISLGFVMINKRSITW